MQQQQSNNTLLNDKIISELETRLMNNTQIEHNKIRSFARNLSQDSELLEKLKNRRNHMMSEVEYPFQKIVLSEGLKFGMAKELINETLTFFKDIRDAKTTEDLEEIIDRSRSFAVLEPRIYPFREQGIEDQENNCCVIS